MCPTMFSGWQQPETSGCRRAHPTASTSSLIARALRTGADHASPRYYQSCSASTLSRRLQERNTRVLEIVSLGYCGSIRQLENRNSL